MNPISTSSAPAAIGPYCQAMVHNGIVYTSGQIHQVLKSLSAVLQEAGSGMDKVVKTTCFLADMQDFAPFNEVYAQYFTGKPARSCVAVRTLPKNVLVEVECIAVVE